MLALITALARTRSEGPKARSVCTVNYKRFPLSEKANQLTFLHTIFSLPAEIKIHPGSSDSNGDELNIIGGKYTSNSEIINTG